MSSMVHIDWQVHRNGAAAVGDVGSVAGPGHVREYDVLVRLCITSHSVCRTCLACLHAGVASCWRVSL